LNARRLWVVVAVLLAGGATVVARSIQVTVIDGGTWKERARRQHEQVIRVPGPRGSITCADGYLLATSLERVAIQVDTHLIPEPVLFARAAAPLLEVASADLVDRLCDGPRTVWLAKRVPAEIGEAVRSLEPTAVALVPDFERVYPLGSVAAPVVGFVGHEELTTIGRAGLEHYYDATLAGEPQSYLAVNDAIQRKVRLELLGRGRAGYDLELTIHARLQAVTERELERALVDLRADAASAVVLDPTSGDILALGSAPSFDPVAPGRVPPERWRLRPVQDAIEPGSTVKPFIAAAAFAAGSVRAGERFDCRARGALVAGHWIRDHVEPGLYLIDEVVAYSANAGIIEIAERVPPDMLWRTFDAFGFGRRTNVGFPAEARGILANVDSWSGLSRAGLAIGQELTSTPLQMALAYAAIANGGWLPEPRLVRRATADLSSVAAAGPRRSRVLDSGLASRLNAMLEAVVVDGTGTQARIRGYRVAGKTGTAQRAVGGGFDDEHHVAWFAGFLPLPDPRLVVVVAIENPRTDFWASSAAAPVFARIAEAAACHLDLPREGGEQTAFLTTRTDGAKGRPGEGT
jgi:cell division protein FtsI/penicillin-binding protein 2